MAFGRRVSAAGGKRIESRITGKYGEGYPPITIEPREEVMETIVITTKRGTYKVYPRPGTTDAFSVEKVIDGSHRTVIWRNEIIRVIPQEASC